MRGEAAHTSMSQSSALIASFDKTRQGYLLRELELIRESLIGSKALIRLVELGHPPEGLTEAFSGDTAADASIILNAYVSEIALANAVLCRKQVLLYVPTVPERGVLAEMKSSKPNWKAFWEYVEKEHVSGCIADEPAWQDDFSRDGLTWRIRLQQILDRLADGFGECLEIKVRWAVVLMRASSAQSASSSKLRLP